MRSALLCILIALVIVQIGGSQVEGDDFRPTPIPLDAWHDKRERVGTLQEVVGTDTPPSVAIVPAHYWEDALRHSVYLTLVRDKIDQLIAKGAAASSDSKPDEPSKKVDDYDLWEKIKSAPFDRLTNDETTSFGDITIMAKGRLMEENGAFRFAEDDTSKETCKQEKCVEGVKAFWSVKRVRQRDLETSPGRYHYELTFSVSSKMPKVQRKPYGNSVRTFTVRESQPLEQQRIYEPINHPKRPQRAIWFHKNIVPTPYHHGRNYNQGLDRIFSSLFSDEDVFEEPRYKPNSYVSHAFPPYSKIGYVASQNDQYQQKPMQYNYKPQSFRYSRPPLSAPPLSPFQPYTDFDGMLNNPSYTSQHGDYRYMPSNIVKTTRPAVLPTPVMPPVPPLSNIKNLTMETTSTKLNLTETTTKSSEIGPSTKMYNKPKPTPMKNNYFTDHVRPPVYSAPPGVFVTMDKKPFKPMPPLKLMHTSRPMKSKPIDFRPSPQVLDVQFSNPEPSLDSAFRPITVNYTDTNTTEKSSIAETNKKRKLAPNGKKPAKKHDNIKSRVTTMTPDIITANSDNFEDTDTMEWANLLGAFTKTTPMASQREKANVTESITSFTPTTVSTTTVTEAEKTTTTTTTTTTTLKPKKRTRPPPKFTKQEKVKKHKRVTTTQAPENTTEGKPANDLIPQASSAATKPSWKPKNKTLSTTPMSTSTSTVLTTLSPSTTTSHLTTTSRTTTTTKTIEPKTTTLQPKRNNRYRQSTLILKGTSVKHDRWSTTNLEKYKSNLLSKYPPRRKGSNFQGYVSSTQKTVDTELNKDHQDHATTPFTNMSSTIEVITENNLENMSKTTKSDHEETDIEYDSNSDLSSDDMHMEEQDEDGDADPEDTLEENDEQESKDHNEFIFEITTTPSEEKNEAEQDQVTTDRIIITSPHTPVKNKTKCKKKKQTSPATTEVNNLLGHIENELATTLVTSTPTPESVITPDFFEELLGGFSLDGSPQETKISQSTAKPEFKDRESGNNGHYAQIDDDFEDFLDSLEKKQNHDEKSDEYEEDDDTDISEEDSPFNNEEENREARNSDDEYNDYQDRQYSLLELMAME